MTSSFGEFIKEILVGGAPEPLRALWHTRTGVDPLQVIEHQKKFREKVLPIYVAGFVSLFVCLLFASLAILAQATWGEMPFIVVSVTALIISVSILVYVSVMLLVARIRFPGKVRGFDVSLYHFCKWQGLNLNEMVFLTIDNFKYRAKIVINEADEEVKAASKEDKEEMIEYREVKKYHLKLLSLLDK